MPLYELTYRDGEASVVIEAPSEEEALKSVVRGLRIRKALREQIEYWNLHPDYWEVVAGPLVQIGWCWNCDLIWDVDKIIPLSEVPDLGERLDPGKEVPLGECPMCGAFAYVAYRPEQEVKERNDRQELGA
jgi:hypothetical protein